jgi:hypothetical protein
MTPRVLFDYAVNTGEFYRQHCEMAREGASARVWQLHVRVNLLPSLRKQTHEPYEGMSRAELDEVASELSTYDRNHLDESDGA